MSYRPYGHRHTGGVRGTRLLRADCPVCGRDTAGGRADRPGVTIMRIILKPHNDPVTGQPCQGSGKVTVAARYGDTDLS